MEIEEAKKRLLSQVDILFNDNRDVELENISNVLNRIISQDIKAPVSVPNFPKSAMDGYAVNSEDVKNASKTNPVRLKVIDEILAGDFKDISYSKNTAVRVMTGGLIPEGYDGVIMQEKTDLGMDYVEIYDEIKPYMNYCKVGEDIMESEIIISKNTKLNRSHIGLLSSLGIKKVEVYIPIKVGIISSGSELMDINEPLKPGKIYNSISYMLKAQLESMGIEVLTTICEDNMDLLIKKVNEFIDKVDVLITTGGVSVGKKDLLPIVLEKINAKEIFKKANIKPGTPTRGSVYKNKIILSLSGNPYAALANFDYYFWDIYAKLSGDDSMKLESGLAKLGSEYKKMEKTKRLVRAKYENGIVKLFSNNASSVISNMTKCNCYVEIEKEREYSVGDSVKIHFIK